MNTNDSIKAEKIAVWIIFLFNIFYLTGFCFFHPRTEMHDELSLFNPIYMYLHYGKMTFPANGFFESMVSHPPIHYMEIAWLMKLGFNSFYAAIFPAFFFSILAMTLIVRSAFPNLIKLGMLIGMAVPIVDGFYLVHLQALRPDYTLAMAWLAGLIALESGRLENWNRKLLFLGAFLLVYASALHYFAIVAFTGIAVYILWAWGTLDTDTAKSKIRTMALGGGVVGVPFLLLFFLPNLKEIMFWVSINQNKWGEGGILDAIRMHREQYFIFKDWFSLLKPFYWLGLPAIFGGSLLLLLFDKTRGIALACLPIPLFVYLYSRGKSAGYFLPEIIIFYIGLWISILYLVKGLILRARPSWWSTIILFWITLFALSSFNNKYYAFTEEMQLKPRDYEMHLARACMKKIVGQDATITGRENIWYIGGANHWYDLTGDFVYADSVGDKNVTAHFSQFDAVVEHNPGANLTFVKELETISSWYADSTLQLKGFYLTNNNLEISDLAMIALSPDKTEKITGFACDRYHNLFSFEEASDGDHIFAVYVCPNDSSYRIFEEYTPFLNIIPLPDPNGAINQMGSDAKENLVLTIMPYDDYINNRKKFNEHFKIREEIKMKRQMLNLTKLINDLKQSDKTIEFYQSMEELLSEK